jgi:hypothetical protein
VRHVVVDRSQPPRYPALRRTLRADDGGNLPLRKPAAPESAGATGRRLILDADAVVSPFPVGRRRTRCRTRRCASMKKSRLDVVTETDRTHCVRIRYQRREEEGAR